MSESKVGWGFPDGTSGREPACNARDARDSGSIPGSGRSPGGCNGNPLKYSCLENPINRGASWATVHGVTELEHRPMGGWLLTLGGQAGLLQGGDISTSGTRAGTMPSRSLAPRS